MPPRQIRAADANCHSSPNDAILDRSVTLNSTVSGLTHLTGLTSSDGWTTENADAPSAVTDQSGSPLLRMRDEAKRESFALMDNIGLGKAFAVSKSHDEDQSKASSSKLESYLNKKSKSRTAKEEEWQRQTTLHPQPKPYVQAKAHARHPHDGLASGEYEAALLASSEYTSFDDHSAISRKHHLNKAQGWFPWELDAVSDQAGGRLDPAGITTPKDHHQQQPEEAAGTSASFSEWGRTAARTARILLGRCHVLMDEHDVDEWIEAASSTIGKALRAGRAQCVASCNATS